MAVGGAVGVALTRADDDGPETDDENAAPPSHPLLQLLGAVVPLAPGYDQSGRFFVWSDSEPAAPAQSCSAPRSPVLATFFRCGSCLAQVVLLPGQAVARWLGLRGLRATPLLAALVVIEATDMVFAADSIPAVLSVTTDPFVAYTSNILAVLGLRALFFALAAAMTRMAYLGTALGLILLFIGAKLLLALASVHVSLELTLGVVLGTLALAGLLALVRPHPTVASLTSVNVSV